MTEQRAQTNVIAVVLLAGMILASATVIVYAGSMAFDDDRNELSFASAEQSMQTLQSEIERASNGNGGDASASLSRLDRGAATLDESAGEISMEVVDTSTGTTLSDESRTFGAVVYEQGDRTVAYQGGGVFETSGNGSVVVSPPPVSYRTNGDEPTLTLPVISVRGDSLDDDVSISRTSTSEFFAAANPVPRGTRLVVRVQSRYYLAWGRLFEERIGADVSYDHDAEVVEFVMERPDTGGVISSVVISDETASTVNNHGSVDSYDSDITRYDLQTPGTVADIRIDGSIEINKQTIAGQVHATEGILANNNGEFTIEGEVRSGPGGSEIELQSKDIVFKDTFSTHESLSVKSSRDPKFHGDIIVGGTLGTTGDFSTNEIIEGSVHVHDTAEISGQTTILGDLVVDGDVTLESTVTVEGDVIASGSVDSNGATILGSEEEFTSVDDEIRDPLQPQVPDKPSAEPRIDAKESQISGDHDNTGADDIEANGGNWVIDCTGSCELTSGAYYLDELQTDGDLTLDTTSGDIEIYVHESIDIQDEVEITGPNEVRIYTGGNGVTGDTLRIDSNVIVSDENGIRTDKASHLWIYMKDDADVFIKGGGGDANSIDFTGVLYGPGDSGPGADMTLENHVDVYGAIIGNIESWDNHAEMHYDESLGDEEALHRDDDDGPPSVVYIQSTSRTVELN